MTSIQESGLSTRRSRMRRMLSRRANKISSRQSIRRKRPRRRLRKT